MLTHLYIKNYALIEEVKLDFNSGFTVITGETGAGKSILLGALGLLLGNRADLSSIGNPEKKCILEAQFDIKAYNLQNLFDQEDLDYESHTIIRREILPSSKSRAFINDTPVTLSQLSTLGRHLVDIHSQHQTLKVTSNDFQFQVLDAFAGTANEVVQYTQLYTFFKSQKKKLANLKAQRQEAIKEEEYTSFLLDELIQANLKVGEQQELESRYDTLNNVEQIAQGLSEAYQLLTREELGVNEILPEVKRNINKLSGYSSNLKELNDRLESAIIEFQDIAETVSDIAANTEGDPEELAKLEARIKLLFELQKKHQVEDVEALIAIRENLDKEAQSLQELDSSISKLENDIATTYKNLVKQAGVISQKRNKAIKPLTQHLQKILSELGMPHARFDITLEKREDLRDNGVEDLHFLFSANKGMSPQELKKAASGGELSRIMLAIKSILSDYANLPTLIFDEIDTGVSGEIALKMGEIMKTMATRMQILSITHLPQIAGQGAHHYKVYKEDSEARTTTGILKLTAPARIEEIAQMLGGKTKSTAALDHARQLLNE